MERKTFFMGVWLEGGEGKRLVGSGCGHDFFFFFLINLGDFFFFFVTFFVLIGHHFITRVYE